MTGTERQLLSLLDELRDDPDPGTAALIGMEADVLADNAGDGDPADPQHRAVQELFEYIGLVAQDATVQRSPEQRADRAGIEDQLLAAAIASRRGGSVQAMNCVRRDLDLIAQQVGDMKPEDRDTLRHLLSYVEMKNRRALRLALRCEWGNAGDVRHLERYRDPHPDSPVPGQ